MDGARRKAGLRAATMTFLVFTIAKIVMQYSRMDGMRDLPLAALTVVAFALVAASGTFAGAYATGMRNAASLVGCVVVAMISLITTLPAVAVATRVFPRGEGGVAGTTMVFFIVFVMPFMVSWLLYRGIRKPAGLRPG